ncbi:MAG: DUF5104 domain-containing protein [Clostridiales bacterium]|nr:DUF5104 domain-containing protein [Clostridiales bacterium]
MKKKISAILICIMMILGITGCGASEKRTVNPVYADAQDTIAFLIDAIDRKDADAIKDMFSPYAVSKIDNFDEKIDRFIDEFPGWNEDYELSDTFQRWSNHGKITNILTPSYDFVIDDKIYRMRIIYYKKSDEDESKLGWYSLQIWERYNDSYTDGCYMHGVDDEPDILLWDYLKDE